MTRPRQIREVVVDKKILERFKRQALKDYPKETAAQLYGSLKRRAAHVYAIVPAEMTAQAKHGCDFEFDDACGTKHAGITLLGSLHTHPGSGFGTEPSDADILSADHDGELIFGIYAIRLSAKRKFISCKFYSAADGEVELVISES